MMMKKLALASFLFFAASHAYAQGDMTLDMLAKSPETKGAFMAMVGKTVLPAWVHQGGSGSPAHSVVIGGKTMMVISGCKPHDCAAERIAVLYSPEMKMMSGVFSEVHDKSGMEKLMWMHMGHDNEMDAKTVLYAALAGSLENHPDSFNFK